MIFHDFPPTPIDRFADQILQQVDAATRMHCQADDCYELADISDTRTSLHYCKAHYWRMRDRAINWAANDSRDYHE